MRRLTTHLGAQSYLENRLKHEYEDESRRLTVAMTITHFHRAESSRTSSNLEANAETKMQAPIKAYFHVHPAACPPMNQHSLPLEISSATMLLILESDFEGPTVEGQ